MEDSTLEQFQLFLEGYKDALLHTHSTEDGLNVAVIRLNFHVALYVNPESDGISFSYDHRYCYADISAAKAAIALYELSGEWMLWQKDHCNQVSVTDGYLYAAGVHHSPENSLGLAGWNEKSVAAGRYEIYHVEIGPSRDRVWIHCSDGSTVGRFGKMGLDLHNSVTEQLTGARECRLCSHTPVTFEDWQLFREKARDWWSVDVPLDAICQTVFSLPVQAS